MNEALAPPHGPLPAREARALPRRRRWAAPLALLAMLVAVGAFLYERYTGMTAGIVNQLRYGTLDEARNVWAYVSYLLAFLQKLTYDPTTATYNFQRTPEAGLDGYERGRLAFHRGEFSRAAALLERHLARRGESEEALFWLALSYMRLAEAENCLAPLRDPHAGHAGHDAASFCSLPLRRVHERQEASRQAARALERLLDRYGDGSDGRLYRWLLNFSYMTVDGFPREVPARHLLRTPFIDAFYGGEAAQRRREHAHLRFTDRARELGVENFGTGRGVAVEDFDDDGDLDLVGTGSFGGVRYFRNEGGARFTDATAGSGLGSVRQPLTVSMADYDGDGWMDLFVVRPYEHYLLFRNQGNGTFTDVTRASGLLDSLPAGTIATSWISTWGDIDNDGDLDLFVTNWAFRVPFVEGLAARPRQDSRLFRNEDGRFRDVTAEWGIAGRVEDRHLIGGAFGDYDGDGWADLYLTGPLPGTSALLRNLSGRRFAAESAAAWHEPGFTASFVDFDHDGRLDVFHGGFSDARTAVTQAVFGEHRDDYRSGHNAILLQGPAGRFTPRKDVFEDRMAMGSMGASYGDLDNDGCLDFYIGTGNPEPWFILPNLMYRGEELGGRCTGRLRNVSMLGGFGNVQKGHGIVFFDFDGDGDQDVYSSLGGMWPADPWLSQLFVNESAVRNAWTKIRLRGRRSNRFGVGSMIEVRAVGENGSPIVRTYHMDGKTGFGSAPYLAHIGLGRAARIAEVRVAWLGSGCRGRYAARLGELNVLDEADCLAGKVP